MTYKIIYIDEQEDDSNDFKDFVESKDADNLFSVEHLYPASTLEEMLDLIKEASPDALVSDFNLNEHIKILGYNVPYNGMKLVTSFLEIRDKFPCFVMTSFASEAANFSDDVNIVYIKNDLLPNTDNDKKDLNFLERIKIQVDHYRTRIDNAEQQLITLLEIRSRNELSAGQEQELIELDTFLEASVDNRSTKIIPAEFKKLSNSKKLADLLISVESLIKKVEANA